MARSIVDEDIPRTEDEEEEQPKVKPKVIPKAQPKVEVEPEIRIVTENQLILNMLEQVLKQNEGIIKGLKTLGANLD